jgi:hypothetical protein
MSKTERTTVILGGVAGVLALALFALAVITQGSQGQFQVNKPSVEFAAQLVSRASVLRADLGIDFIFMCLYAAFFVSLALVLKAWARDKPFRDPITTIANMATGALLITAVLDAAENAHILAMLAMAEQGQAIPQGEIAGQMVESMIKFMFSYFGLFVLSFALPSETIIEKVLVFSLRCLQLPIGVGIFVMPTDLARPLFICRAY